VTDQAGGNAGLFGAPMQAMPPRLPKARL